jgi:hypothetical protein
VEQVITASLKANSTVEQVQGFIDTLAANAVLPQDFSLTQFRHSGSCFSGVLAIRDQFEFKWTWSVDSEKVVLQSLCFRVLRFASDCLREVLLRFIDHAHLQLYYDEVWACVRVLSSKDEHRVDARSLFWVRRAFCVFF